MDYPRNVIEFEEFFPDEEAAHRYLEGLRWPEGFHCPRCAETTAAWRSGRGLLICAACRQQISVTAGTLFDKTRKPLRSWFHVAWEITNAKQGVNALTMQHRLGLRSYQTAWSWLHKFRRAMVRPDRDRLTGEVEVDEAYVGGEETGVRGRQTKTKSIVLIAVEVRGDRHGRIRLRHVPDVSGKSLAGFVKDAVERDSVVKTDGWSGYSGLTTHHYARGGFAGGAELYAPRPRGSRAGSLDDFAHPSADRCGDASGGIYVGPGAPRGGRPPEGPHGRDRRHDVGSQRRHAEYRPTGSGRKLSSLSDPPRRGTSWRVLIARGRRRPRTKTGPAPTIPTQKSRG